MVIDGMQTETTGTADTVKRVRVALPRGSYRIATTVETPATVDMAWLADHRAREDSSAFERAHLLAEPEISAITVLRAVLRAAHLIRKEAL